MEVVELRERVAQLEKHLERHPCFENIISLSASMERVLERARMAAGTDASVLLLGETGTGKEMLARAIHAASARARMPFVAVNSGALPHELVESELFGFRKGAFTGAYADAPGIFSAATGGTVFLDEIGEMPKEVQVKLLRVLQEKELRPVGGTHAVPVDVRIVAATNRSLSELRSNLLREDLYFRIATVVVEVPPCAPGRRTSWCCRSISPRAFPAVTAARFRCRVPLSNSCSPTRSPAMCASWRISWKALPLSPRTIPKSSPKRT